MGVGRRHREGNMMRGVARVLAGMALCGTALAQPAGRWEGTYTCLQGDTALLLTIRDGVAPGIRAVFQFYALDANPDVPDGCFTMTGAYEPDSRAVALVAGEWLLQPPNYVTVDLLGTVSPDGQAMVGEVLGPGCTAFTVRRTGPPGTPAASCRGGVVSSR